MLKTNPNERPRRATPMRLAARLSVALGIALIALASHNTQAATAPAGAPIAAPATLALVPMYAATEVMQGLYSHHLPPLSQRFVVQANALVAATQQYCQTGPTPTASLTAQQAAWTTLHGQWQQTIVAWESLSTPAVGPLLTRRSQRQIDFWPTRAELLTKALAKAPQTLTDMEIVGTLAKGLPAYELLLAQWRPVAQSQSTAMPQASCHYLELVAQGVQLEAVELNGELITWAGKDWSDAPDDATTAMNEWVNQWLAALER